MLVIHRRPRAKLVIGTWSDLIADPKLMISKHIAHGLVYSHLNTEYNNVPYTVTRLSEWDEDHDGHVKAIKASMRDVSNKSGYYFHQMRDSLSNLLITVRGKPKWLFECMPGMLTYQAARNNCSKEEQVTNLLGGLLRPYVEGGQQSLLKKCHRLRRNHKTAENKLDEMVAAIEDKDELIRRLTAEKEVMEKEMLTKIAEAERAAKDSTSAIDDLRRRLLDAGVIKPRADAAPPSNLAHFVL